MTNRGFNNEEKQRLMTNLEDEIQQLKAVSQKINGTISRQKSTRDGLSDYLQQGVDALKKINVTLNEMGSKYSLFGCNGVIIVGIAFMTILILIML